jgi:beta-lactam-binding protein with PASTA domain
VETVPTVLNGSLANEEANLSQIGFPESIRMANVIGNMSISTRLVAGQSPPEGTKVPVGTTVTLLQMTRSACRPTDRPTGPWKV